MSLPKALLERAHLDLKVSNTEQVFQQLDQLFLVNITSIQSFGEHFPAMYSRRCEWIARDKTFVRVESGDSVEMEIWGREVEGVQAEMRRGRVANKRPAR